MSCFLSVLLEHHEVLIVNLFTTVNLCLDNNLFSLDWRHISIKQFSLNSSGLLRLWMGQHKFIYIHKCARLVTIVLGCRLLKVHVNSLTGSALT